LLPRAEELLNLTIQILEIAENSTVIRGYNGVYGVTDLERAPESDGGHTNLMSDIANKALKFIYGPETNKFPGEYTKDDIMEVCRRHDLPENYTGDQIENGERKDKELAIIEKEYQEMYSDLSPDYAKESEKRILRLVLEEFPKGSSPIGRVVLMSDKIAAIISTLIQEFLSEEPKITIKAPKMAIDYPGATKQDKNNMEECERVVDDYCSASEMWTVDFFKRDLDKYDDTGFFTAIVVFATLLVNYKWYNWRDKHYDTTLI
jgi:hypothetical protein